MVEEMKALAKNKTWELITLPMGEKPVGCKWVFTVKHRPDGSIERYKARLVAKGFTQMYGVDYQETFALVAKMNTIRILLSCAVNLEWDLQQFDVKNTFLHGDLEEEVYMKIPLGFENGKTKGKVYRLKKALKYIPDLLEEIGMLGCKPAESPIEANHKLQTGVGGSVDIGRYQRLVGRLIYLSHTRLDIAYTVGLVSQYVHDPCEPHLEAIFCILRYLKSVAGKGLLFSKYVHLQIKAFTNADLGGSLDDRRSTSGYCTFVGSNLVTWRSKKQNVTARSSTEIEFRVMA
ncbi:uncharacterized mitochondrial protein AtMg00810-like [Hevea brasiliensis]|uniref:uncharacterized mitochondrial protein AtMg00810-like n=1 Tax=Hevea brasiliensis TaxID=3981 RepID=UPI0025DD4380|nr:uncharacterized mitochondrial protein AtMg00810-like [Hevea brasiliensis]